MIVFSSLLTGSLFKARSRVSLNDSNRENERLKKDIRVSVSLLAMNLLFFYFFICSQFFISFVLQIHYFGMNFSLYLKFKKQHQQLNQMTEMRSHQIRRKRRKHIQIDKLHKFLCFFKKNIKNHV